MYQKRGSLLQYTVNLLALISRIIGTMECKVLETIKDFADYVALLRNVTSDDISATAMEACRQEICSALYGNGNADVSGVGVGYVKMR